MITRRDLVKALRDRTIAHWVVVEHVQDIVTIDELADIHRREQRTRTTLVVHHDVTRGRGSARITLSASDGRAQAVVEQALALATTTIGPAWKTVPPAAPAKVEILDPELEDPATRAAELVRAVPRPEGASVAARVEVTSERVYVQAKTGFHDDWAASAYRIDLLVGAGERSLELVREARRPQELDLEATVTTAIGDLRELAGASATAPTPGKCTLVLSTDAMLHGGGFGIWQVFASQADANVEQRGLRRYRLGGTIVEGADQTVEPLSIASDGALDWATRSAPVGDEGDAIRRFPIIEKGIAIGVGLGMREAALLDQDPNGGVRNLVVGRGTWTGKLGGERTIVVRRLRALSIDPITGDASLEIALAEDHEANRKRVFSGGTVRLDLVAALAHARRNANMVLRGAYYGPVSVMVEGVELIA